MFIEAPLSNGQLYSLREIESCPPASLADANLPATWDLRGWSAERVDTALRELVERHEALRTSYHLRDGVPVQRVHARVDPPIERVDRAVTDFGDPDRTTTDLLGEAIPMTGGLCWRGVLVSTDGAPMFLSLSFSHLILDVWSTMELAARFRALAAGEPVEPGPAPVELAHGRRSELARSRQAGAERYWRRVLADETLPRFPCPSAGEESRRIQATLFSHRLGGAAAAAAKRLGVTPPAVLLALVAAGLSKHTGADRIALSVMSSNRFSEEHRKAVGTLNQLIPVVAAVDPGATLGEHVTRLHWACAKAYRHAGYDIDRVTALAPAGARGFSTLFPCWFNYLRLDGVASDPADETPAVLEWSPTPRQYGQPFDVRVTVRDGRTALAVRTDPDLVPAAALTDLLRTVALGAHRAATEPDSTVRELLSAVGTGVPQPLFPVLPDRPNP
ncbi:condensation domain-containing protein [Actinokineospora xionganensis]|uniref:Condensation domain-containing protein n=1 Tax=Actinokineospora xionganensis TaxID=2684470 RepID=A0ABR7L3W4_9PSEU|nr:condensation domain-containing protein [Actinokineospora xionganensis]MBC6447376.1 hypothetical protein [Actinokineospora xionganensis]